MHESELNVVLPNREVSHLLFKQATIGLVE